jgi:UDP-N-acetylenolpyruvoylglucosamine reductase
MMLAVTEAIDNLAERDAAIAEVAASLNVRAERGPRFAELTSLRVGAVDWVLSRDSEEQAAALVSELEKRRFAWRPLGSGSNVLADDGAHHYAIWSLKGLKSRSGL